jgi:hypothetical protein
MQSNQINIETIRHGVQYFPRDKQPSMYEILSDQ